MNRQDGTCPFCSNFLDPSSSICPGCGRNIFQSPRITTRLTDQPDVSQPEQSSWIGARQTGTSWCLPLALVVVALCLLLVVETILGVTRTISVCFLLCSSPEPKLSLPTSTTVITKIQNMGKLETVTYTLEKVISYDPDAGQWYHFLGNRKKLFVVHGYVTAGIDLSGLRKEDINRQEETASITLTVPAPQLLHWKVDPNKTQVYDADSGVYALWKNDLDPNTTLQIEAAAEDSLRSDACQAGILQQASDSAKVQLKSFLMALGFQDVTVNPAEIPASACG